MLAIPRELANHAGSRLDGIGHVDCIADRRPLQTPLFDSCQISGIPGLAKSVCGSFGFGNYGRLAFSIKLSTYASLDRRSHIRLNLIPTGESVSHVEQSND